MRLYRIERAKPLIGAKHYDRADVLDITAAAVQSAIRRLDRIEFAARCSECGSILSSDGLCDACLEGDVP